MMKIKNLILILLLQVIVAGSFSQELRCNISVNTQKIEGTNKKLFNTMQTALYEFMNSRSWTNHSFAMNERIECNILINITDQSGADEFRGTIQIQSRRPVFNSSYNSVLLNYVDNNVNFKYVEYEVIELNESSHQSNLAAMLAFYAYIILGLDYDSFSPEGGTEFFLKAEKIVNLAQGSSDKGWKPYDSKSNKNRYWLIKNILDKRYSPLREFNYRYHRLGLDLMESKPVEGRNEITESLQLLQKVFREKPDPFLHFLTVVFDAKADELVNIYSDALPDEKSRSFQILNEIDVANAAKYKKIKEATE